MIAKVIVHARDRKGALKLLEDALTNFDIHGLKTNIPFILRTLQADAFEKGDVHTELASDIVESMKK